MKPITRDKDCSGYFCMYDYGELIDSFELEVLCQAHEHDYQGDSLYLFRDDKGRVGLLQYGWGSCSGCDALQACETIEEVNKLRDRLYSEIEWLDSFDAAVAYVKGKDWDGGHWYKELKKEFLAEVDKVVESRKQNG